MQIVKIGPVELTMDDAEKLYTSGEKYLVTFSKIYQIHFSQAQKTYYGSVVYSCAKGANLAKRGRFHAFTAREVNNLLGYKLLNEEV